MRVGRYVGWKLKEKQDEKGSERSLKEGQNVHRGDKSAKFGQGTG